MKEVNSEKYHESGGRKWAAIRIATYDLETAMLVYAYLSGSYDKEMWTSDDSDHAIALHRQHYVVKHAFEDYARVVLA